VSSFHEAIGTSSRHKALITQDFERVKRSQTVELSESDDALLRELGIRSRVVFHGPVLTAREGDVELPDPPSFTDIKPLFEAATPNRPDKVAEPKVEIDDTLLLELQTGDIRP
jgi:hypothetical protein